MRLVLAAAALAFSFAPTAVGHAQYATTAAVAPGTVTFSAASIKKHVGVAGGSFVGRQPGGRLAATAATLRELIEFAYRLQRYQLVGGPTWIEQDRWDVAATLEAPPARVAPGAVDDTMLALRALLRDRFRLSVRAETRDQPIYALTLARTDGRLGPQLVRSPIDCEALIADVLRTGGQPPPEARSCGVRGRVGSIQAGGSTTRELAEALSTRLLRAVIDRTGLAGPWDITLTYTADPSQIAPGTFAPGTEPQFDPGGPSIFTAMQEQLGLKLESTRGPVDVLVVERADPATEN
jgi:bla regulator protein blaR1